MIMFFQVIINGLMIGSIYALSAMGLTLVWGIMDIVNLAHGEFIILGAYMTFFLFTLYGVNPLLSLLLTIPAGIVVGGIIHFLFIRSVIGKPPLISLLLTFGISIAGNNIMLQLFTGDPRSVLWASHSWIVGDLIFSQARLIAFSLAMLITLCSFFFLARTYSGRAIRAIMQNQEAAAAMGVPINRILLLAFIMGTVLAMMAGTLASIVLPFEPPYALTYGIISFVIVVVGGLGRPLGALLGGFLVGILENITGSYISQAYTPMTVSVLLILFLIFRPAGLFGRVVR